MDSTGFQDVDVGLALPGRGGSSRGLAQLLSACRDDDGRAAKTKIQCVATRFGLMS